MLTTPVVEYLESVRRVAPVTYAVVELWNVRKIDVALREPEFTQPLPPRPQVELRSSQKLEDVLGGDTVAQGGESFISTTQFI